MDYLQSRESKELANSYSLRCQARVRESGLRNYGVRVQQSPENKLKGHCKEFPSHCVTSEPFLSLSMCNRPHMCGAVFILRR